MKLTVNRCRVASAFLLLFTSSSALVAAPVCSSAAADSDGDGWGWENNDSCIVETAATTDDANTTQPQIAFCSTAAADIDGDGWGWENNNSCIITLNATTAASNSSPSSLGSSINPVVCSSAAADVDGDGWGWENSGSCIVGANTTTDSNNTPAVTSSGTDPQICSSAAADQDGDGWGWEEGNSCVVGDNNTNNTLQQPIPAQTPPTPTPASPAIVTPSQIKIMPLGDSITHGYVRDNAESYRKPFTNLLSTNECQFEMTGSQTGNYQHNTYVAPHESYSGHTADQILNGHNDAAGNNEGISVTINRYQPDVVLLHIGSNDMRLGQNINDTISEIDQIISIVLAADSAPDVLVANVIPWYGNARIESQVTLLGNEIEAYLAQLNNSRVRLVDVRGGYQPSMMLSDRVHPNPSGEQHIAERFFAAYRTAGFCE